MKARSKSDYKQFFKSLKDIFNFGKHKGKTIEGVISFDPSYILWAHDEKVAKFTDEILEYADEAETNERLSDAIDAQDFGIDIWDFMAD